MIQNVNLTYSKANKAEPYKVHRVLKNKIDDLTTVSTSLANNLNANLRSPTDPLPLHGQGHSQYGYDTETTDLDGLVKILQSNRHDLPHTLRDLWTGRPGHHREKDDERMLKRTDLNEEDEDSLTNLLWRGTGKVHKKSQALVDGIAGWTG